MAMEPSEKASLIPKDSVSKTSIMNVFGLNLVFCQSQQRKCVSGKPCKITESATKLNKNNGDGFLTVIHGL